MIELERITYTYPDTSGPVLRDLSLSVDEGEFLLVIGPSGAGKSTFLRCLNGLVPHFYGGRIRGRCRIAGGDPIASGPRAMSDLVGFVFQDPEAQFVVDTVEDELAFAMENFNLPQPLMRKRVEEVLDQLGIAPLRNRHISTLSGGEKQRVAIAAVLTMQPRILVLDEPTSQLDPQAAEEVLTALRQLNEDLGLTIVLAEHRLERVVQYTDRVLAFHSMAESPLIGLPADVLQQVETTPPLITLGKALEWEPLPLTIRDGRRFAQRLRQAWRAEHDLAPALPPPPTSPATPSEPASLSIHDLWFSYDDHEALRGVNLEIKRGEFVALMGRNGSGKTTLLKHLVGLLKPQRGQVVAVGRDTRHAPVEEIAQRVGYVPQDPGALLFAETLREELAFTRKGRGLPASADSDDALLTRLGLSDMVDRDPRDLSGGERQRAALAAILVGEPDVILLDEPTRGLDYVQKQRLSALLRGEQARGRTILMATHDVELVATCADRVVMMAEGQVIVDGPTRSVMTESLIFSSQINKLFRDPAFLTVEDALTFASKTMQSEVEGG